MDNESYDHTVGIPTINIFFEGFIYVFGASDIPALHVITNNTATGMRILPSQADILQIKSQDVSVVVLSKPPEAIIVRPDVRMDPK